MGTGLWCLFDWNRFSCVSMFAHDAGYTDSKQEHS